MDEELPKAIERPRRAAAFPEPLVLEAWSQLEGEMRAMTDAIRPSRAGSLFILPLKIEEAGPQLGLSDDEVHSLTTLRSLRNRIAYNAEARLDWEDALEFQNTAERLLTHMKDHWQQRRTKSKLLADQASTYDATI